MTDIKKDEKCLFCNIENSSTEIIYQDEEYLAFRDIKPAASHHYLIIPRNHIKNTSCLSASHLSLVKKLIEIGEGILRSNSVDVLDKYDARFGFHVPPFNSIQHLHLHVIYPVSEIGFLGRLIFKPDSYWFMDASTLIEKLEKSVTSENTN